MKIFVAASYSTQVNYETGEVFPEYRKWLEDTLAVVDSLNHEVFCALRDDQYRINDADPETAVLEDLQHLKSCDVLIALLSQTPSTGVQTEIGYALALQKRVILAHLLKDKLTYFNAALIRAGFAQAIELPFSKQHLQSMLPTKH